MLNPSANSSKLGIAALRRIDDGDVNVRNARMPEGLLDALDVVLCRTIVIAIGKDDNFRLVPAVRPVTWSRVEDIPNCVP